MNIKRDTLDKIRKKAETKDDGVYSYQDYAYAVKNKNLLFIGDCYRGDISQFYAGFMCEIGKTEVHGYGKDTVSVKKKLKQLLKET